MAAPRMPAFRGRAHERHAVDGLLDGVRAGSSAVLVIRGEAGIGKTALMRHCARQAAGCRLVQVDGVESEMKLPFAALHQFCRPMLSCLAVLPEPQQRALQVAFGLAADPAPDRFVVGLAVLSLLTAFAVARPLICLIDDAQWLDEASSQVIGFVGRRLLAEPVGLLFAVREAADERLFPGLPALTIEGLTGEDARALLAAVIPGHLDQRVSDRIIAETGGNPLGLLELAREMTEAELAGGFAGPRQPSLSGHLQSQLQDLYLRRIRVLPGPVQQLMLLAAADPTGDATLLWRAAGTLGLGPSAVAPADAEQLLNIGSQVRFRHPLVRSAAYVAGSPEDRRAAHLTLAAATNARTDPERRVWHLAAAATGPDEDIAAALEQAAAKIQARAGLAASAAFLERSVMLTADPRRRADRALAAALANLRAGTFDIALGLLAQAEAHAVDDLQRARVEQLRGQIEWASVSGREAPALLLQAAKRLESLDVKLARETYLYAWVASHLAGPLARPGGRLLDVSRAAQAAPQPAGAPRPCDLLLDGLTTMIVQGRAAAEPALRQAVAAFLDDQVSDEEWLQWGIFAQMAAMAAWDFDSWVALSARHVELARALGALAPLSIALNGRGSVATHCGDFETATVLAVEKDVVNEVTGIRLATTCDLLLAGYRGRPAEAVSLFSATSEESTARGEGLAVQMANWSAAVLHNGLGRYAEALAVAEPATDETYSPLSTQLVLPELIEAAVRTGRADLANQALDRLSAMTVIEGSDWAKSLEARSRALVSTGQVAEQGYAEAVERLGRTRLRPELGRAHLLYGEWLRRENRRLDARHQLRAAYDLFVAVGAEAFAERARRELLATGEKVRKRDVDTYDRLTPQEEHIARLARDGRTNHEIGAELFISTRTVEWHLRKVFARLGISSRRELHNALPRRLYGAWPCRGRRGPVVSTGANPRLESLVSSLTELREAAMSTTQDRPAIEVRDGYAEIGDIRLHYVEAGEGPLVVLLHGFPEFWYGWRRQIQPLAAAGFRVVAPDLRGYNLSSRPDGVAAYDTAPLVADIRGLIRERGAESAMLAGHDWGGTVAWDTAMQHPEVVSRLAILNAAHPRKLSQGLHHPSQLRRSWYFFFFDLPDLPETVVHANDWHFFRHFLRDTSPAFTPEETKRYVEAWSQPGAATGMINYYRSSVRQNQKEAVAAIRPVQAPTLVIWGERDRYLNPDLAEPDHDDVPHLDRVERLPDASHWVHHDEAERVTQHLTDFFGKQ